MDVHVPLAITHGLRLRGIDVLTAQEDHAASFPDPVLLDRALTLQRTLFSQDVDMLAESTRRLRAGIPFAGVVYIHQLRTTIGQCVNDLELIALTCEPAEMANRVEFLPL